MRGLAIRCPTFTNSRQITIAAQRSDDWLLEETPVKFPIPPGVPATEAPRHVRGPILKELQLADTERRIKEAEATMRSLQEKFEKDKQAWGAQRPKDAVGF
jgi:hypothetical protein